MLPGSTRKHAENLGERPAFLALCVLCVLLASCADVGPPYSWTAGYHPPGSRECEWIDKSGQRKKFEDGCIVEQQTEVRPDQDDLTGTRHFYLDGPKKTTIVKAYNPLRCGEGELKPGAAAKLFRLAGIAGITPDGEHDLACQFDTARKTWSCREVDNCEKRKCLGPYEFIPELGANACVLEPTSKTY